MRILSCSAVLLLVLAIALGAYRQINFTGSVFGALPRAGSFDLSGQFHLVTGVNTGGIGVYNAKALYEQGAHVILACRNLKKCQESLNFIESNAKKTVNGGTLECLPLDLSSFKSIESFAQLFLAKNVPIASLVNNAGISTDNTGRTHEGLGEVIGVNHFGTFYLTQLLLPAIIASNARIVVVSSNLHGRGVVDFDDISGLNNLTGIMGGLTAYCNSKLMNVLFARSLAQRLAQTGVRTYSLHPGFIATELTREASGFQSAVIGFFHNVVAMDTEQGAQTQIYASVDPSLAAHSGAYLEHCRVSECANAACFDDTADRLWAASVKITGLDNTPAARAAAAATSH